MGFRETRERDVGRLAFSVERQADIADVEQYGQRLTERFGGLEDAQQPARRSGGMAAPQVPDADLPIEMGQSRMLPMGHPPEEVAASLSGTPSSIRIPQDDDATASLAFGGSPAPRPNYAAGAGNGAQPAPTDFNTYVRQSAAQRGLDPEQVAAVVGKEGPTGWGSVGTFNTGTSYGPLQLHYAGGSQPTAGMGDDFTKATGIDLRKVDPNMPEGIAAHQRAVDYALDRLSATGDYREWYGAGPALGDRFTKVNRIEPAQPQAPSAAPPVGTYTKDLQVNQITQGAAEGLTTAEALAICGPAAAVAFSRAVGRNPTLREAKELGSSLGVWNVGQGMAGPESQVKLLGAMGVPARLQQGADEATIGREVLAGRPVTIDTPGHFYVAQSYDPQTRTFDFGESAKVLKASGGRSRFRLDELASLGMGAPRSTIYLSGEGGR
jgi:hypothetical protein